jgi:hypothetical protein
MYIYNSPIKIFIYKKEVKVVRPAAAIYGDELDEHEKEDPEDGKEINLSS